MKTPKILETEIGRTVAYSAAFLRSTGMQAGPWGQQRGVVVELKGIYATVLWKGDAEPMRIHLGNLAHVGPNLRFCAG